METINLPLTSAFESKTIELADRFQKAKPGDQFKLFLYDQGGVTVDGVLAFYDILQTRTAGIGVHVHSHVCLMGAEVLIWLAGDTRTLRSNGWIHFQEYPRHRLERSDLQHYQDTLEGKELSLSAGKTAFQENYLAIERLVKKHLPTQFWNRRIWGGELSEWNIMTPAITVLVPVPVLSNSGDASEPAAAGIAEVTGRLVQKTLF